MRLIDADAFVAAAIESKRFVFSTRDIINDKFVVETVYADLLTTVNNMPTVDAAPVVHGQWIDSKGAIRCSKCMNEPLYDYHGRLKLSMACPTCGAKMWKEK